MTTSLTILSPDNAVLISPSETDIVVSVTDTVNDPGRTLNVSVNAALVFTRVGAATTFLAAGYSVVVSTPGPNTAQYTLTKTSPWADPQAIAISADYTPVPLGPTLTAIRQLIAAEFPIKASTPSENQPDASVRTSVALSLGQIGGPDIDGFSVMLNGNTALQFQAPNSITWSYPDYAGNINVATDFGTVFINPRRYFNAEETVEVQIDADLSVGATQATTTYSYKFYTPPRRSPLSNQALAYSRVDQTFSGYPAIETLRYALKGALQARALSAPYIVLIYDRILRCSLASVAVIFGQDSLKQEVAKLVPEDLVAPVEALVPLESFQILWESAVAESKEIGIEETVLGLIEKAYASPYPQERLGAISGLVLLNANARL